MMPVHLVLCIDNSGSMRKCDHRSRSGGEVQRCEAVFEQCRNLAQSQLGNSAQIVVTTILFDDKATVHARAEPLTPALLQQLLPGMPRDGTNFSAAWAAIEKTISTTAAAVHKVIFLSDGRPGELSANKTMPSMGAEPSTVRAHQREFASAPSIVGRLSETHGKAFALYAVAIGQDDSRWLSRLAQIAASKGATGEFDAVITDVGSADRQYSQLGAPAMGSSKPNFVIGDTVTLAEGCNAKGGVLQRGQLAILTEFPNGQDVCRIRVLPEGRCEWRRVQTLAKHAAVPSPAGRQGRQQMISEDGAGAMLPPPAIRRDSSGVRTRSSATLGAAFNSISSSITASIARTGGRGARPRVLRQVCFEHGNAWKTGPMDPHVELLTANVLGGSDNSGSSNRRVIIRMRQNPFAKGGQRNAYHMWDEHGVHCVAKESRWADDRLQSSVEVSLQEHRTTMEATRWAQHLASCFNSALSNIASHYWDERKISVESCSLYEVSQVRSSVKRHMLVERYLEGKWEKFNGNNGFINKTTEACFHVEQLPHAFSHWSFEHTMELEQEGDQAFGGHPAMVCDIQGVGTRYTDVTVCTQNRRFGATDLGPRGFQQFFLTHTCNDVCRALGLHNCVACPPEEGGGLASASTATSAIEMIRTKHLQSRKRQRQIETIEMQAALKHGQKAPGNVVGTVKHMYNGVALVTDAAHKVGVTTYPIAKRRIVPAVPTFGAGGW
jgi:hypothetical protein